MFARIDQFLAKHVFQPVVIFLCHLTGFSQWKIYRDLWFIGVALIVLSSDHIFWQLFFGAIMIFCLLRAAVIPDSFPDRSFQFFRLFWVFILMQDTLNYALGIAPFTKIISSLIILIAEYATTIDTLPPKRKKGRKRALAKSKA